MSDSIFTKIVKGEIPSHQLYETENILVFLDAFPISKGHTLIIPKSQYENIFDLPANIASEILPVAKKIISAIDRSFGAQGYNFVQNNGEYSGQQVMHYHMHIIPRYSESGKPGVENIHTDNSYKPSFEDLKEIKDQIISNLD